MANIYKINKDKFKSIYFSYNLTMTVNEKENSENAVLAAVLAKSCEKYKTQKEIEKHLNGLYGSNFDINVEKFGDLYNIEFRMECINKEFLPQKEDIVKEVLDFLYNMIYIPDIKDLKFDEDTVKREKEFILDKIKARKDDKLVYAVGKTEELMCKDEGFGWYVYGNENIVNKITSGDLYKRYLSVINNSCITVIVSGNLTGYDSIEETIKEVFKEKLETNINYSLLNPNMSERLTKQEITEISEIQDTTQSVITFGLKVENPTPEDFFVLNIYNAVLGATPSSKLFQNFREKESLAYTVRSRYYRYKSIFVIYAGIKKSNYEKAKEVIIRELNDICIGNITDEEFFASKESIISDLKEWNDSKIALSKMLLSNLIAYNGELVYLEDIIENIKKVKKEDVVLAANRINVEKIFFLGGEADE